MKVCSVEGCEGKELARGYCGKHYQRFKKSGDPLKVLRNKGHDGSCSIEGCVEEYASRGYCTKHYNRFYRHGDPLKGNDAYYVQLTKVTVDGVELEAKECMKCRVIKSLNEFRIQRHGTGGRGGHCKPCTAVDSVKYSLENKEKISARSAKYHRENKEKRCKAAARIHKLNKEKRSAQSKAYYEANRDARAQYAKIWQKENKEKVRATSHRRRAKISNAVSNDFTEKDWIKSLNHFKNECAYCGCKGKKLHQEHVVPIFKGGSNTITNIVPACAKCNMNKKTEFIEDWYHKKPFYSKQREQKIYKWIGYKTHEDALQTTLF